MEDLTFSTLIAVFEEIFGRGLFWLLVGAAAVVTALYLYVLIRDRHIGWQKFLIAQLFMPVGAIAAIWFVMAITGSSMSDIGGPIDVIVVLGVAGLGAVGVAILAYTVDALFIHRGTSRNTKN